MTPTPAHASTGSRSLASALSGRDNALNLVRLGLALLVIFGHAFPLGGFTAFQYGPFLHAGWHGQAVVGFFAISGFLILGSALRMPLLPYLWRRFLRIYPGYIIALLVTAFVAAPIGHLIDPRVPWSGAEALRFVIESLDLKVGTLPVSADPQVIATGHAWNGSLWTLFYEGLAYVLVGLLVAVPAVARHIRWVSPAAALVLTAAQAAPGIDDLVHTVLPGTLGNLLLAGLPLSAAFTWGMTMHGIATQIHLRPAVTAAAAICLAILLSITGAPWFITGLIGIPLTVYTVLTAGALLPWRLGATNDLSYGVYVYAYPVQVLLILLGITSVGWFLTATACAVCTLPIAAASWWLVEKPALSLKNMVSTGPVDGQSHGGN